MSSVKGFAKFIIVLTTITAAIMELLDTTIVNVALNQMAGSLGATIEDIAWVITSYAIANVIIIPMTGFLGEYFGRKTYYLTSMILFGIASYFCGASHGLWELVFWRFIQGIGGGALLSTSQAILFDAFTPQDRPMASGLFGMGIILGPTLGPVIGGYIVDNFTWQQIFFVNIPICILASILTIVFIDKKEGEGQKKHLITIDYTGIFLLTLGIGSLQYVLEKGESEDWFQSRQIVTVSLLAAIGLIGFIWRELTTDHPVVNLKIFNHKVFAVSTIFTLVAGFGLFTSVFVYPVLVQRINGFTPYETGLSLLFPTLAGVVLFPLMGKRMSKGDSPIPYMTIGILFFIFFGFYSATATTDMGRWDFFPMQLMRIIGVAMLQMPLINQAVAGLKPSEYPTGIALTNMIRQLGGAFGIALANNFTTNRAAQHRSDLMANMVQENPLFNERVSNAARNMINLTGDAYTATTKAYMQIEMAVNKQAYYLAYLDTFRLVSIFFVFVLPFLFLLKGKKVSAEEAKAVAKAAAESH
ncbi:MFS transporter, DHA2 family, multidrug resistance protein [Pseudarcicella hirudinis]|uniref:MFS transporter, DHA2 family, multidrug resistance protein n=1 Tax=Pseudarcicella hirudinis TaxID=1079859 RepID=A0A1I5RDA7_9BACT|nr:DHA2 family efflux MFS transporter permease subunit [Pseudarcicella hirudinis]SFP56558.1 MFS transporter, DHA2 family, multidrug resistance protein [Pseudarcicella hirudinis]